MISQPSAGEARITDAQEEKENLTRVGISSFANSPLGNDRDDRRR